MYVSQKAFQLGLKSSLKFSTLPRPKMSEETKKKIGDSHRGIKSVNFGKKQSEEIIKKRAISLKGHKVWCTGLTKETDIRLKKMGESIKITRRTLNETKEQKRKKNTIMKMKWRNLNPEKVKAEILAKRHIPLKDKCEICRDTKNLQRHHWRYDKPLLVNTLCAYCHVAQHHKHKNRKNKIIQEIPQEVNNV